MAMRRRIVRKPVDEVDEDEIEAQEEAVEEADVEAEEAEDAEDEEDVEEEDDEEEEVPAPRVARKVAVPPTASKVAPKAAPAPVKPAAKVAAPAPKAVAAPVKAAVPAKPAPKAVAVPVDEEEEVEEDAPKAAEIKPLVKVQTIKSVAMDELVCRIMDSLTVGQSIVITRTADDKLTIGPANAGKVEKAKAKLSSAEYFAEVLSPEYVQWQEEWTGLTYDEKVSRAKKAKITWEEHTDPRVNILRLADAYRLAKGIEKYKPEYKTRKTREALKG